MRIKNAEFTISAVKESQYPKDQLKQVVLVGKSNVGKSSFINTLVNRKKLARTSSQPGKTRLINFYKVRSEVKEEENQDFYFVDLPGYGFSKMSKEEQVRVGKFIEEYLKKCEDISLVIFLIDIRHEPTENDKLMYRYIISQNIPCIVIANKADKLAPTKVESRVEELQAMLNPLKDLTFLPFSSERKVYSESVLQNIEKHIIA